MTHDEPCSMAPDDKHDLISREFVRTFLNLFTAFFSSCMLFFHLFHNIAGSLIQISSPYHNLPENLGTTRYEGIHHNPAVNNNHFIFMGFSGILTHFRYLNALQIEKYTFTSSCLCRTI